MRVPEPPKEIRFPGKDEKKREEPTEVKTRDELGKRIHDDIRQSSFRARMPRQPKYDDEPTIQMPGRSRLNRNNQRYINPGRNQRGSNRRKY